MTQLTVLLFLAYVSAHRKGQLCFSPHKGRPERRLSGETPRPWSSRQILLSKGSQSQKLRPVWPHLHGTPKTGTLPETPSRPREGAAADTQGCPLQADGNVLGGFPGSSDSKESACNAGDPPGSGRSPGEGNGYPLQYSCLETPRDGGTWWAAIHGVAQSQTWLNWLSSSSRGRRGGLSNLFGSKRGDKNKENVVLLKPREERV